jgi:hypothetical protein
MLVHNRNWKLLSGSVASSSSQATPRPWRGRGRWRSPRGPTSTGSQSEQHCEFLASCRYFPFFWVPGKSRTRHSHNLSSSHNQYPEFKKLKIVSYLLSIRIFCSPIHHLNSPFFSSFPSHFHLKRYKSRDE